jgi:hypothetical protein
MAIALNVFAGRPDQTLAGRARLEFAPCPDASKADGIDFSLFDMCKICLASVSLPF